MRRAATEIVGDALRDPTPVVSHEPDAEGSDNVRSRLLKIGAAAAVAICLVIAAFVVTPPTHPDRASLRGSDIAQISPYLSKAQRDGDGAGPSFVGTLDASWAELQPNEQEAYAIDMVALLRVDGARNIVIYDSDHRVRVQAIGDGAVQFPAVDSSAL
jgi:hypothetical protein